MLLARLASTMEPRLALILALSFAPTNARDIKDTATSVGKGIVDAGQGLAGGIASGIGGLIHHYTSKPPSFPPPVAPPPSPP